MDANTEAIVNGMIIDGGRITWTHVGNDVLFQRKERIYDALKSSGCSDLEISEKATWNVVKSGKDSNRFLDVVFLDGKALKIVLLQLPHLWRHVTEIHLKTYLVPIHPMSNSQFVDACYHAKGNVTVATFRGIPSTRSRRTSGEKGLRLGNAKSDTHISVYTGRNEKTGIEVHAKGKALVNVKREVDNFFNNAASEYTEADKCSMFTFQAKRKAARKITKTLRSLGVNIGHFFSATSMVSWTDALYDDVWHDFDNELEAHLIAITTNTVARIRNLPINFEESSD